jgi:hypothetical protein
VHQDVANNRRPIGRCDTPRGRTVPTAAVDRAERRTPGAARAYAAHVELEFSGEVWHWRGPSPYHFVTVPEHESDQLRAAASLVSYGWGMVPVLLSIGSTRATTSLFPKDGGYVVPLKDKVRTAERIAIGDIVTVHLAVDV